MGSAEGGWRGGRQSCEHARVCIDGEWGSVDTDKWGSISQWRHMCQQQARLAPGLPSWQSARSIAAIGSNLQAKLSLMSSLLFVLQCRNCLQGVPIPEHIVRMLQASGDVRARGASDTGHDPEDLREDIRRMKKLIEDLELKLAMASSRKASVAKDELVTSSSSRSQRSVLADVGDVPVKEKMHEALQVDEVPDVADVADLADGADVADVADVLPAHGIPDVADVVDIVSGSSNDTEWYPDDPYMS